MKIKQAIKYGALAGASFATGYMMAKATDGSTHESTAHSMSYSVDRAYELMDDADEQVKTLEEIGLDDKAKYIRSANDKLHKSIAQAKANGEDHVNVQITADEFVAWTISILGKESDLDGTRR